MLVLCVIEVHLCQFLCVSPLPLLQQGHNNLSALTDINPKFRIDGVAAAVSAAAG